MTTENEQLSKLLQWGQPIPIWDPATFLKGLDVVDPAIKTRVNVAYLDLQIANHQNQISYLGEVKDIIGGCR